LTAWFFEGTASNGRFQPRRIRSCMVERCILCAYTVELLKFYVQKGSMSPLLLQEGRSATQVMQRLYAFCPVGSRFFSARWWRVGGLGLAMTINRSFTSSPIQLSKNRGILRANRAPALVNERFAVV
jgi:hypothetical protein